MPLFFVPVRRHPLCEKPRQHLPEMLLSAEEDRENPDIVFSFNPIEPDDGRSVVPALRPSVF